ncbi:MAG: hypothetical protein NDI66_01815 [Pseudomonas sp.]|nr:hypothetical protein [Pseudomonas sp.]
MDDISLDGSGGYAVFFFPPALEALGDAITPYLTDGPGGPHVLCREIDTGGALIEMTLDGQATDGREVALELMVPTSMVRMIVSVRSDGAFGFGPRIPIAGPTTDLPPVGPHAQPATSPTTAVPGEPPAPAPDGAPAETLRGRDPLLD